ncbi:hypothetical protein [Pinibacter soli]|uniref:Outer membrane protein beta-barrel domain-containing protein n=1 Tax=Pinibacter soli TaxID=3044211 RepID=A0ABT6R8T8_9BACT|nr:hypothetical protein [Pinibacter soli]MDI3318302.1 hypothetical protein [Pinibacter soli]
MKNRVHALACKCVLSICALCLSIMSFGQVRLFDNAEAGITIGPSNFLGDLGGNAGKGTTFLKDNNFPMTKLTVGAHLTFNPSPLIGVRLALNYGTLVGDDAIIKPKGGYEEARLNRNQRFKSTLWEGFLAAEIFPTVMFEENPDDVYHKLRPYGLIGVGAFHFNPQGKDPLTGNWVYLKPLSTEGQGFSEYPERKPYNLTQLCIPMGLGLKYYFNDNFAMGLEIIYRKTFTDYIDDVSTDYINPALFDQHFGAGSQKAEMAKRIADQRLQIHPGDNKRGTPENKDAYYTVGLKLSFRLQSSDPWSNSTRCPSMHY